MRRWPLLFGDRVLREETWTDSDGVTPRPTQLWSHRWPDYVQESESRSGRLDSHLHQRDESRLKFDDPTITGQTVKYKIHLLCLVYQESLTFDRPSEGVYGYRFRPRLWLILVRRLTWLDTKLRLRWQRVVWRLRTVFEYVIVFSIKGKGTDLLTEIVETGGRFWQRGI